MHRITKGSLCKAVEHRGMNKDSDSPVRNKLAHLASNHDNRNGCIHLKELSPYQELKAIVLNLCV